MSGDRLQVAIATAFILAVVVAGSYAAWLGWHA